jgi:hypothetical protein
MTEMKYGVASLDELTPAPVNAGKHTNVRLTEIAFEEVGEKKIPTLSFKFQFPEGKTFTHREFPVNSESIAKNIMKFRGASVKEIVERETNRLAASIIHIMSAFVPKEHLVFIANSWEDYCKKMVEIAGTSYEGQLFRCKVVYTKKGYLSFPKTTVSPWFQNMQDPDTITVNPKWDMVTPPVPTNEAKLEATQLDLETNLTLGSEDELEF